MEVMCSVLLACYQPIRTEFGLFHSPVTYCKGRKCLFFSLRIRATYFSLTKPKQALTIAYQHTATQQAKATILSSEASRHDRAYKARDSGRIQEAHSPPSQQELLRLSCKH